MRRAVIATAATVVGLVALLDYKGSGTVSRSHVAVGTPQPPTNGATTTTTPPSSPPSTATPSTTAPSTAAPSTAAPSTAAPSTAAPTTTSSPKQFTGTDVTYTYGDIAVRVTVDKGRVTAITFPQESATDPRSQSINDQALPILTQEALSAQSINIDVVSGATYTSDAFATSLQSALKRAGK